MLTDKNIIEKFVSHYDKKKSNINPDFILELFDDLKDFFGFEKAFMNCDGDDKLSKEFWGNFIDCYEKELHNEQQLKTIASEVNKLEVEIAKKQSDYDQIKGYFRDSEQARQIKEELELLKKDYTNKILRGKAILNVFNKGLADKVEFANQKEHQFENIVFQDSGDAIEKLSQLSSQVVQRIKKDELRQELLAKRSEYKELFEHKNYKQESTEIFEDLLNAKLDKIAYLQSEDEYGIAVIDKKIAEYQDELEALHFIKMQEEKRDELLQAARLEPQNAVLLDEVDRLVNEKFLPKTAIETLKLRLLAAHADLVLQDLILEAGNEKVKELGLNRITRFNEEKLQNIIVSTEEEIKSILQYANIVKKCSQDIESQFNSAIKNNIVLIDDVTLFNAELEIRSAKIALACMSDEITKIPFDSQNVINYIGKSEKALQDIINKNYANIFEQTVINSIFDENFYQNDMPVKEKLPAILGVESFIEINSNHNEHGLEQYESVLLTARDNLIQYKNKISLTKTECSVVQQKIADKIGMLQNQITTSSGICHPDNKENLSQALQLIEKRLLEATRTEQEAIAAIEEKYLVDIKLLMKREYKNQTAFKRQADKLYEKAIADIKVVEKGKYQKVLFTIEHLPILLEQAKLLESSAQEMVPPFFVDIDELYEFEIEKNAKILALDEQLQKQSERFSRRSEVLAKKQDTYKEEIARFTNDVIKEDLDTSNLQPPYSFEKSRLDYQKEEIELLHRGLQDITAQTEALLIEKRQLAQKLRAKHVELNIRKRSLLVGENVSRFEDFIELNADNPKVFFTKLQEKVKENRESQQQIYDAAYDVIAHLPVLGLPKEFKNGQPILDETEKKVFIKSYLVLLAAKQTAEQELATEDNLSNRARLQDFQQAFDILSNKLLDSQEQAVAGFMLLPEDLKRSLIIRISQIDDLAPEARLAASQALDQEILKIIEEKKVATVKAGFNENLKKIGVLGKRIQANPRIYDGLIDIQVALLDLDLMSKRIKTFLDNESYGNNLELKAKREEELERLESEISHMRNLFDKDLKQVGKILITSNDDMGNIEWLINNSTHYLTRVGYIAGAVIPAAAVSYGLVQAIPYLTPINTPLAVAAGAGAVVTPIIATEIGLEAGRIATQYDNKNLSERLSDKDYRKIQKDEETFKKSKTLKESLQKRYNNITANYKEASKNVAFNFLEPLFKWVRNNKTEAALALATIGIMIGLAVPMILSSIAAPIVAPITAMAAAVSAIYFAFPVAYVGVAATITLITGSVLFQKLVKRPLSNKSSSKLRHANTLILGTLGAIAGTLTCAALFIIPVLMAPAIGAVAAAAGTVAAYSVTTGLGLATLGVVAYWARRQIANLFRGKNKNDTEKLEHRKAGTVADKLNSVRSSLLKNLSIVAVATVGLLFLASAPFLAPIIGGTAALGLTVLFYGSSILLGVGLTMKIGVSVYNRFISDRTGRFLNHAESVLKHQGKEGIAVELALSPEHRELKKLVDNLNSQLQGQYDLITFRISQNRDMYNQLNRALKLANTPEEITSLKIARKRQFDQIQRELYALDLMAEVKKDVQNIVAEIKDCQGEVKLRKQQELKSKLETYFELVFQGYHKTYYADKAYDRRVAKVECLEQGMTERRAQRLENIKQCSRESFLTYEFNQDREKSEDAKMSLERTQKQIDKLKELKDSLEVWVNDVHKQSAYEPVQKSVQSQEFVVTKPTAPLV